MEYKLYLLISSALHLSDKNNSLFSDMSGYDSEYFKELAENLLEDYNQRNQNDILDEDEVSLRSSPTNSLSLESVGFDFKENLEHITNKFEITNGNHPSAVFRRGQSFSLNTRFNRPYSPDDDTLHLTFEYGPGSKSSFENGTKFRIPVPTANRNKQWDVSISDKSGSSLKLQVKVFVLAKRLAVIKTIGQKFFEGSTSKFEEKLSGMVYVECYYKFKV